jgi:citrate lyase beta subunit
MYMPGTKDFSQAILTKKYRGLTTMVLCFEDSCSIADVPKAEINSIHLLEVLLDEIEKGTINYNEMPLIIFRVRNYEEFVHFTDMLQPKHMKLICAFNFPKFNKSNGKQYFQKLQELNLRFGEIVYGMPILEDVTIAYKESRVSELLSIKSILDEYKELVLNIRVGGTDFSACFGVRRNINYTIYDIITVSDCLLDILNIFSREGGYTVSGPVWEYFLVNKDLKFKESIKYGIHEALIKKAPIVDIAIDGLLREVSLDILNGFIGKTIIHPSHLNYVNGMLAVTEEEYNDAKQILETPGGVVKSLTNNKMNEIGPHRYWSEKILMRAQAYGVIKDELSYLDLIL